MDKIIIIGASDFARLVTLYLEECFEIVAYSVNKKYINSNTFLNKPIVALEDLEEKYPSEKYKVFIAIGYNNMNFTRETIFKYLKEKRYKCVSYVHPSCVIAKDFVLKENVCILESNTIQPFVEIGENSFIWAKTIICHESKIGNNCFIASNVCINGCVQVENNCFIGAGATLRDHIKVGYKSLIGACCHILNDVQANSCIKACKNIELEIDNSNIKI